MATTLGELRDSLQGCLKCPLGRTRTNLVFGVGSEGASVMFVGEAPGYYEDQQGEPFVGRAGRLLDKLLHKIGFTRADVYIGNVLKCRPPENRDPIAEEIEACKGFLFEQIALIEPVVVATLGNFSTQLLLEKTVYISKVHGEVYPGHGFHIFPIYHPAAALRNPNLIGVMEEDFLKLKMLLQEQPPPPEPVQASLF